MGYLGEPVCQVDDEMDGPVGPETSATLDIPEEILMKIFRWSTDEEDRVKPLLTLQLVCKRWLQIVDSAPTLWATINVLDGWKTTAMALKKSRERLIDIIYRPNKHGINLEDFLWQTVNKIGQWRSVDFESLELLPRYSALQTTVPRSLERLCMACRSGFWFKTPTVQLFGGAPAPRSLLHVSIRHVMVALESLELANLRFLELDVSTQMTFVDLWRIIEQSPHLTSLALKLEHLWLPDSQLPQDPLGPVHLSALSYLSISLPTPATTLILSSIRTPVLTVLNIQCNLKNKPVLSSLFTSATSHLIPSISSIISLAKDISITYQKDHPRGYILSMKVGNLNLELNAGSRRTSLDKCAETLVKWFAEHSLPYITALPASLRFDGVNPSLEDVWILNSTLQVKCLNLEELPGSPPLKIRFGLKAPHPTFSEWLFPNLETLNYDISSIAIPRLVEILTSRYAHLS
ncbi:hypothetical protein FRB90_011828, partial [Tulasnella sp. 427]